MRYCLIRDKKIFELNESEIEVCDSTEEINNFSIKEIMNLLNELKESDFTDPDIYVDIFAILKNMKELNQIYELNFKKLSDLKDITHGEFSRYLLKIQ